MTTQYSQSLEIKAEDVKTLIQNVLQERDNFHATDIKFYVSPADYNMGDFVTITVTGTNELAGIPVEEVREYNSMNPEPLNAIFEYWLQKSGMSGKLNFVHWQTDESDGDYGMSSSKKFIGIKIKLK